MILCDNNINENKIIEMYKNDKYTLRHLAEVFETNHHKIKRILLKNGVSITRRNTLKEFTKTHKDNISKACKGRAGFWKGKKMPKVSLYKNMANHIRFDISFEWLMQFDDIEKLKYLNRTITPRDKRFDIDTKWYKEYVLKFYNDKQFNDIYSKWLSVGKKDKYLMPTIDHIIPKAKNGNNQLSNLQFLTLFENRAKNDMPMDVWQKLKENIKEYLL
jgi:5-methylcytosine-specific restriction endonuclease McrA